jgi:hypothetical protein
LIMGIGARRGLAPARRRELAAASYAESGLNPQAVNRSSGAAGLFQLLSSGYRQRAQQLGGLFNPRANTLAIINDYVNYWRQNPQAAPGAAGRDVEKSGMGAKFYSRPLAQIPTGGGLGGVETLPYRPGRDAGLNARPLPVARPGPRFSPIPLIARSFLSGRGLDWGQIAQTFRQQAMRPQVSQQRQTRPAQMAAPAKPNQVPTEPGTVPHRRGEAPAGALAEAFYDPLGSWDQGRFGGPIGGHSDHVHLSITNPQSMLAAISQAQQMGLRASENPFIDPVDPVHVRGSFHYRDFPGRYRGRRLGEAIDVSGDPSKMAAYYRWATSALR